MVRSVSGHANLLKAISISFSAGALILKGLREAFPSVTEHSAMGQGRKPSKIRPLQCFGGIFFTIPPTCLA